MASLAFSNEPIIAFLPGFPLTKSIQASTFGNILPLAKCPDSIYEFASLTVNSSNASCSGVLQLIYTLSTAVKINKYATVSYEIIELSTTDTVDYTIEDYKINVKGESDNLFHSYALVTKVGY